MAPIRTALVHNIVTPYRNVLFNALSDHKKVDLHVFYCAESHDKRNWTVPDNLGHDHTFLSGITFDRSDTHFHANPSVISKLVRDEFEVTIVGGISNLTMQLGFLTSKMSCDGNVLWTERILPPVNPIGKLVSPLFRTFANRADSLIVPTNTARQFQQKRGIEQRRIYTAPNVVDNTVYYNNDTGGNPIRILFVGQLIERKGISYLIDAYSMIDNDEVELYIVGDGPRRRAFERRARQQNLEVIFTGWISENQKRRLFANADLFVLPSIEDLAPLVLNEALASGLPVLTTEGVGNAPDMIVKGGNGYIVPTADTDALAKRLASLTSNSDKLEKMGQRSERISDERFSPTVAANQFAKAVEAAALK